ncbi:MAG TPA: hypothetical protein PK177_14955 [Burkholderiaceae bacterium]|nr:hypothetical protein [Burkholderiaceae bacterium]
MIVKDERSDLIEVLTDVLEISGIQTSETEFQKTDVAPVASALKKLVDHPLNQTDGRVHVRAGEHHFPLNKTLYSALVIAASLAPAVLQVTAGDPLGGGLGIAAVLLGAIEKAGELITRLDEDEVAAYDALAQVMKSRCGARWHFASSSAPRVTVEEIKNRFDERGELAPNLQATLTRLCDKKVIQSEMRDRTCYYWIEP